MGQESKEGLTTIQVEGLDAIQAAIYRKEDPPRMGIKKIKGGRNREREWNWELCN